MRLKGKVAIVTGAGGGIGKALATRLAQDGASIVVADLQKFDQAAAEIAKKTGARTLGLETDVASEDQVERMAAQAVKTFGRIDILVNNAAIFSSLELRPFEKISAAEWRKVMDVNTLGVFLCCRACAPHMRAAGGGRIINLASGAPLKGVPLFLHYISSKGAVIASTPSFAGSNPDRRTNMTSRNATLAVYVPLNFFNDKSTTFVVGEANRTDFRSMGIGSLANSKSVGFTGDAVEATFDESQTKDSLHTLTLTWRISVGRTLA
jgi:NADP-dependent 3-hydroxy acid dehydrogenase YdfG